MTLYRHTHSIAQHSMLAAGVRLQRVVVPTGRMGALCAHRKTDTRDCTITSSCCRSSHDVTNSKSNCWR